MFDVRLYVMERQYDPLVFVEGKWQMLDQFLPKVYKFSWIEADTPYEFSSQPRDGRMAACGNSSGGVGTMEVG